jgi:hypothetical protein
VVLYTGNDFTDALTGAERAGELRIPERPAGYFDALVAANALLPGVVPQGFNQIYLLRTFPALVDRAVEITARELEKIQARCARDGAKLLVVLLPTKMDIEWATDAERLAHVRERLALTDDDLALPRRLSARLQGRLAAASVPYVDLTDRLQQARGKLYWKEDYHLNDQGHDLAAQVVFERIERTGG